MNSQLLRYGFIQSCSQPRGYIARKLVPAHPYPVGSVRQPCQLFAASSAYQTACWSSTSRRISLSFPPIPQRSTRAKTPLCISPHSPSCLIPQGIRGISSRSPKDQSNLQSNSTYLICAAAVAAIVGTLASLKSVYQDQRTDETEDSPKDPLTTDSMAPQLLEGRPGNLTPEQEEKLRKLWNSIFQLCGVVSNGETQSADALAPKDQEAATDNDSGRKKRFGLFRKSRGESKSSTGSPLSGDAAVKDGDDDDKYGQTKQFHETLANHSPETIRETIWSMVKHDHPDALVLRFLRARKWDVEKALVMLVSTMNWRHSEMRVDDDIMKNGEAAAAENEKSDDAETKKMGHDFMAQIRMGKSFLHGTDKNGRPICVVRVRLHKQGEQCEESLERYTVYIIETARMVLSPPVDTATIIFDMTGFSMANMDYTPVKFMIKCFEANYPESLGAVLVHNAPWIFQGIWKVIRGWLDPVVAGKVHFTNNKAELTEFIEPGRILKELDGDEDWEYKYVEPVPGENDKMKDTETAQRLLKSREDLVKQFETATIEWINNAEGDAAKSIKAKRDNLAQQLREGYWTLDPYVRARSLYDRVGAIQPDGKTDWYKADTTSSNGPSAPETSPDDVD